MGNKRVKGGRRALIGESPPEVYTGLYALSWAAVVRHARRYTQAVCLRDGDKLALLCKIGQS